MRTPFSSSWLVYFLFYFILFFSFSPPTAGSVGHRGCRIENGVDAAYSYCVFFGFLIERGYFVESGVFLFHVNIFYFF